MMSIVLHPKNDATSLSFEMRILVVLPHYFHPEPNARHSSVDETKRTVRKEVIERVLGAWRHQIGGPQAILDLEQGRVDILNPGSNEVTIAVLTMQGRHLIDDEFAKRNRIHIVECKVDNPRMLGHEHLGLFSDNRHRYDFFVFSEDDIIIGDELFFDKIHWFNEMFGYKRVLMPNRFEWNLNGPTPKTFIDGDIGVNIVSRWIDNRIDEYYVSSSAFGKSWSFRRARNPHSGMHILTREQLDYWRSQGHWADKDVSFIGPLESAATLGILKTFAIYKSWGSSINFLTVEHLDRRYSSIPNQAVSK